MKEMYMQLFELHYIIIKTFGSLCIKYFNI